MIYGYDVRTMNEYGLKQMREISIAGTPEALRQLAAFLLQAADELDRSAMSSNWHRHAPLSLQGALGCDVAILDRGPTN